MTDMLHPPTFQNLVPSQKTPFFSSPFLCRLAARAASLGLGLWAACPPDSVFYNQGYLPSSSSSPSWSALWSLSAAPSSSPSRPPSSVAIKYLSSGLTAYSFASRLANHLLSGRRCHPIPSTLSLLLKNPSLPSPFSAVGVEAIYWLICLSTPPAFCCLPLPNSALANSMKQ